MSSSRATQASEEASKARPATGQRIMITVVIFLSMAVVLLIASLILMQKEIRSLKSSLAEFEFLDGDDARTQHKAQTSKLAKRRITLRRQIKGKQEPPPRSQQGKCEPITIPFCQNMSYTMGQFPNLLNHQTQEDAKAAITAPEVTKLIQSQCSPEIRPLLCSVFVPPCNGLGRTVVPCKELCRRVTKACKNEIKQSKIELIPSMRCRRLPKESSPKCFDGSWPRNTPATSCKQVSFPQCANYSNRISPWRAQFPNYFGHMSEDEAMAGLNRFDPIWPLAGTDSKCASTLSHFLCNMYAPKCTSSKTRLPPCRELCLDARSKCKGFLRLIRKESGFIWPKDVECKNFPRKGTDPCYMKPKTEVTASSASPTGKCQSIKIPLCKNVPYNMTQFPNAFQHKTQEEAALEAHQFWPLVEVNCADDLAFFLCSLYAPLCSLLEKPVPPCRGLCSRVRRGCEPLLRRYGFRWPERMACEQFPEFHDEEVCLDRPTATAATIKPSPPITSKEEERCEALTVPLCSNLQHKYNMTRLPNYFKHLTQREAAQEVDQFFPLVRVNCSADLALLLCSVYAPPCEGPHKPCRELCNRVKRGCAGVLREFGILWPESIACEKFPLGRADEICLDTQKIPATTAQTSVPKDDRFLSSGNGTEYMDTSSVGGHSTAVPSTTHG